MKRTFLIFLLICSPSMAYDLITKMRLVDEQNGERRYDGKTIVQGTYSIFEDGELNFLPAGSKQYIGFSNEEAALKLLALQKVKANIDVTKICGLQGSAKIEVLGLVTGEGPARPWQTTHLARVINKSRPSYVACKANKSLHTDAIRRQ